ncbi:MAG: hypothetical protein GQ542_17350 [Desulforhopalus sp.]|nr:hypothetical protein [Desulforhopalus sp.]
MNPGRTPAWIGCSHPPDKITDFTTDLRPSRTFGFKFPEKFETLAMPVDNSIRLYNNESFAPGTPDSGKQNPEEPIGIRIFGCLFTRFITTNCWRSARFFAARFEVILNFDQMNKTKFPSVFIMIPAWQEHANL